MSANHSGRPIVVTICGSMRFYEQMLDTAARLTANGVIVLAPFCVVAPDQQTSQMKAQLDELHLRKIDMSDQIVVVSDGTLYHGESTKREISYALGQGKPVNWSYSPNSFTVHSNTVIRGQEPVR